MINFDDATKKDTKEHNRNWPQIPDHSHRVLVGGSGSGKTNSFINLLTHQPDIDKVYLYAKSPYEAKYIITQFYLAVPKNIRLNFRELQKITFNHSSDTDFQDFMNLYKRGTAKTIFFLSY